MQSAKSDTSTATSSTEPLGTVAGEQAATYIVLDLFPSTTATISPTMTAPRSGGAGGGDGGDGAAIGPLTSAELAEAIARLLASHSRLLYGHAATQGIVGSAGLVQVMCSAAPENLP